MKRRATLAMKNSIIFIFLSVVLIGKLAAVEPIAVLPEHEARYHDLLSELRCLVCQNQTIAESNSELAYDLRFEVNKMLNEGAADSEIINFMADRYGDFVLYKPLIKPKNYLLWFGPFIFLALILFMVIKFVGKQKPSSKSELSDEEKQKLDSILKNTKE